MGRSLDIPRFGTTWVILPTDPSLPGPHTQPPIQASTSTNTIGTPSQVINNTSSLATTASESQTSTLPGTIPVTTSRSLTFTPDHSSTSDGGQQVSQPDTLRSVVTQSVTVVSVSGRTNDITTMPSSASTIDPATSTNVLSSSGTARSSTSMDRGISAGEIAGIAVIVATAASLVTALVVHYYMKRKAKYTPPDDAVGMSHSRYLPSGNTIINSILSSHNGEYDTGKAP